MTNHTIGLEEQHFADLDNCRIVCCIFNTCKFHWSDNDVKTFVSAYYLKEIQN